MADRRISGSRVSAQAGFSLLELMVSMVIFAIVVGAIYMLLAVGRSDAFNTKQRTETMQNARIALNTINRDAINAGVGYWKSGARTPDGTLERLLFLPSETDGAQDWLTPIVPGNEVRTITVDGQPVTTDAVTFVYQDNSFNNGQAIRVSAVVPGTNTLTVTPNNGAAVGGSLYVYVIDDGKEPCLGSLTAISGADKLVFGAGDPLMLNNPGGSSTFALLNPAAASCKRVTWVTYFVSDDNVLIRRVYGQTATLVGSGVEGGGIGGVVPPGSSGSGAGFVEMPLAYGVEGFQVQYLLADGSLVDDVLRIPPAGGNPEIRADVRRQTIRLIRVTVNLRGSQDDPKSGQPVRVELSGSFYTPNLVIPERPSGN